MSLCYIPILKTLYKFFCPASFKPQNKQSVYFIILLLLIILYNFIIKEHIKDCIKMNTSSRHNMPSSDNSND